MIKAINSVVVKEVGAMSAMVFQHICYWMQSQSTDVIYRTNKDLVSDLDHSISESQLQRAKKKLIDSGLITVSFEDKCKWVRTTYYRLTNKGKKLLLNVLNNKQETKPENDSKNTSNNTRTASYKASEDKSGMVVPEISNVAKTVDKIDLNDGSKNLGSKNTCWIPKNEYHEYMKNKVKEEKYNQEPIVPKSMRGSWDEGFSGSKNATKIPDHLLNNPILARMIKRK